MNSYDFLIPTKVHFGAGRAGELGAIVAAGAEARRKAEEISTDGPGRRTALMCSANEWMAPTQRLLTRTLEEAGVEVTARISGITPNPTVSECRSALETYRKGGAEVLVVAGGGSYLDAAKWLAREADPVFFVSLPTTAGTGGEVNEWAVITDDETHEKRSIQCRAADAAILDPELTLPLTPKLTLFSGMDTFSHGLEAILSTGATSVTDALAFRGCALVADNLEACLEDGTDIRARSALLEGSFLNGAAMLNAGLGILHCVSNILPGFYADLSHGYVCGALVPGTLRYNADAVSAATYDALAPLVEKVGEIFRRRTAELGISPPVLDAERLEEFVRYAAANVNGATNPRPVTEEGVREFLESNFTLR
jgi:alcohol dehydrogenase class IV